MKPLSQPVTQLPHFMPNQVLTQTQLNSVVDYLEQQERFTRERLIGIGIVCGLLPNRADSAGLTTVTVSAGVGITSCGYLINVPTGLTLTKQRPYDAKNYAPLKDYQLLELFPGSTAATNVGDITAAQADNTVVVLLLDIEDKPNGKCLGENCDEKGNSYVFTIRVLLIAVSDAEKVIRTANGPLDTSITLDQYFNPAYLLPSVYMERFGNNTNDPTADFALPTIQTYAEFEKDYTYAIVNGAERVAKAIFAAYTLTGKSFMQNNVFVTQLDNPNVFAGYDKSGAANALVATCNSLLDANGGSYIQGNCQYIYDLIRDIIDTYHELREELFAYYAACCPPYNLFPQHLFLGILTVVAQPGKLIPDIFSLPSVYRHHFIPSLAETIEVKYARRIKQLIQRLEYQVTGFGIPPSNVYNQYNRSPINILPDKTHTAPLGERDIPFYYNATITKLYKYWNFDKLVQNRPYENKSYLSNQYTYPAGLNNIYMQSPVLFDIAKYPKLTIEGHVGMHLSQAVAQLKAQRLQYNLSFDLLLLKLGSVNTGGIIADDSLIADLQAQYSASRNELVCCTDDLINYIEKNKSLIELSFALIFYVISSNNKQVDPSVLTEIEKLMGDVLDAFSEALTLMVKALPTDIKLFRFQKLYEIYPAVSTFTSLFKLVITTWGDVEEFLVHTDIKADIALSEVVTVLLNIWELYLDKLSDDCMLATFLTISQLYQERLKTFTYFSEFNKQVHGMEHIAGTTNGGTFVLVYADAPKETNPYNGKVVSETGKPLAGAYIISAKDPAVVYGKTDAQGKYTVEIPQDEEKIIIKRNDFVVQEKPLTDKTVDTATLFAHGYYVKDANAETPAVTDPTDKVYLKFMSSAAQLKDIGAQTTATTTARKITISKKEEKVQGNMLTEILSQIKKPSALFESIVATSKQNFVVVGDFYLPHPIHNYKTKVAPFDACHKLTGVKLIDFNSVSSLISRNIKKDNAGYLAYLSKAQNVGS